MSRHRLTASKIKLARRCLWWARPDVELPPRETSGSAELGIALHSAAEVADPVGYLESVVDGLALSSSELETLRALVDSLVEWQRGAGVTSTRPEIAFALDGSSGRAREIALTGPREYGDACSADEIPGTADVIGELGGRLFVGDYKTGIGPHRLAEHRDQLAFLAACYALTQRRDRVEIAVLHVTSSGVVSDSETLDALDLATIIEEALDLHRRIPAAEARPGFHCEELYCPARAVCPATRALLIDAHLGLDDRRRLPIVGPVTTGPQALAILVAADLIEAWIKERVASVKAYTDRVGFLRREDGKVYRSRTVTRETPMLDAPGALDALREVIGAWSEEAYETKIVSSFETIEKAIRARSAAGVAGPIKAVKEHAREALRNAGALKITQHEVYGWKKEKEGSS